VVALSAAKTLLAEAAQAGASETLAKPFDPGALPPLVAQYCGPPTV
jgi:hypothetical protein